MAIDKAFLPLNLNLNMSYDKYILFQILISNFINVCKLIKCNFLEYTWNMC
jgi:hypothetical protein